ncbi:acyl-ACP--UDP-N-acetylglucosamine O-acyltransferase [uncultured Helicobacter sp.]|uniref:acyl-ACP--UDP-N-acetylglucosamine O-acyltransferase n=2 Tax=uncultured Helicobacter sp. TaxID=175537 RepID=UPI0025D711C8|nr:acyl-ACP--UDP-N-acetylglucosamine O-acyltransferase [uncultured Helicobacter sp.]
MIGKTSIIKDGAQIGQNVQIGEFCIIDENVKIGDDCIIGNYVHISGYTTLGRGNKVFNNAAVGVPPQDLKYAGEKTELIIGDENLIREFTTLNPGTAGGRGKTIIGDRNLFMAYTHVAHDCIVGSDCVLANNATLGGHVELGDYVNIGGLTPLHQFVKVGSGCMIGGGSVLVQDLPPYCLAEGNRAYIRGLNKHRMRKLFSREEIDEISHIYKFLFSRNAPIRELAQAQLESNPSHTIRYICEFILSSTRGIPFRGANNG